MLTMRTWRAACCRRDGAKGLARRAGYSRTLSLPLSLSLSPLSAVLRHSMEFFGCVACVCVSTFFCRLFFAPPPVYFSLQTQAAATIHPHIERSHTIEKLLLCSCLVCDARLASRPSLLQAGYQIRKKSRKEQAAGWLAWLHLFPGKLQERLFAGLISNSEPLFPDL